MDSARQIAHDLNNIAFVISGYAQRIEEELPKTDPLQQDLQAILSEIPRLTAVVDRIRCLGGESPDPVYPPEQVVPAAPSKPRILLVEDEAAVRELFALPSNGGAITSTPGARAPRDSHSATRSRLQTC